MFEIQVMILSLRKNFKIITVSYKSQLFSRKYSWNTIKYPRKLSALQQSRESDYDLVFCSVLHSCKNKYESLKIVFPTQYQMVVPENIHMSNIIQTGQVVLVICV